MERISVQSAGFSTACLSRDFADFMQSESFFRLDGKSENHEYKSAMDHCSGECVVRTAAQFSLCTIYIFHL